MQRLTGITVAQLLGQSRSHFDLNRKKNVQLLTQNVHKIVNTSNLEGTLDIPYSFQNLDTG